MNERVHHALGQAIHRVLSGAWIPQFRLERGLKHGDFKNSDPAPRTAKASAEQAWVAPKCLGQAFIDDIQFAQIWEHRNQGGAEAMGPVGIEMDLQVLDYFLIPLELRMQLSHSKEK